MGDEFDVEVNDLTTGEPAAAEAAQQPEAAAVYARQPGLLQRLAVKANRLLSGLSLPQWNLRSFLYSLLVLILLVLLVRNWTAVRIDLFGWHLDMPKPVFFIVGFVLGAGLHWWWRIHTQRRAAGQQADEQRQPERES